MEHVFSCSLTTIPESMVTKDPASCQQSYVACDSVNNRLPASWYIFLVSCILGNLHCHSTIHKAFWLHSWVQNLDILTGGTTRRGKVNQEEEKFHETTVYQVKLLYILESNPHPFYSFRGLKNQMRIRIACGLDLRWAGFWKNDRAAVSAVRTIQHNNLLFILYITYIIYYSSDSPSSLITESVCLVGKGRLKERCWLEPRTNFFFLFKKSAKTSAD